MNAFQLLKNDHRKARGIMQQLIKEGASDQVDQLFRELKKELEIHTKIEEDHLYPALRSNDVTKEMIAESYHEHAEVKKALKRLDTMDKSGDAWIAGIRELHDNVMHHVQEEERDLFPKAEKVLGANRITELGDKMEKEKGELMNRYH